jgi:hypothetical protein
MADDALFIGWGAVVPGREQKSLQVFQETMQHWAGVQRDGQIESHEAILLQPHGGGLAGFMLLRGEQAKLDALRESDGFRNVIARAGMVVHDLGVLSAYGGESLARQLGAFQAAASDLS